MTAPHKCAAVTRGVVTWYCHMWCSHVVLSHVGARMWCCHMLVHSCGALIHVVMLLEANQQFLEMMGSGFVSTITNAYCSSAYCYQLCIILLFFM